MGRWVWSAAVAVIPLAAETLPAMLLLAMLLTAGLLPAPAGAIGFGSITRDDFPVFDEPRMLSAAEADRRQAVLPRDAVIGVAHGGEARAYPIVIMGVHELGNDRIAGLPIAITW